MKRLILCSVLFLSSHALAADCSIKDHQAPIQVTGREVVIGSQSFPVRGSASRAMFMNNLSQCGFNQASNRFRQWRASRRAVNWEVGLGLLVAWPALVGIPISGINAGTRKQQMIAAINAGQ